MSGLSIKSSSPSLSKTSTEINDIPVVKSTADTPESNVSSVDNDFVPDDADQKFNSFAEESLKVSVTKKASETADEGSESEPFGSYALLVNPVVAGFQDEIDPNDIGVNLEDKHFQDSQEIQIDQGGVSERKEYVGAGWLTTSFLLINTAVGIGILNFPAAYNQAGGIYFGTAIQILMVLLMMSTMLILAYCSDMNGDKTYHDVMFSMFGKIGQQLAALTISLILYCVCIASLIIIGDQMDSLLHTIVGPHFCDYWYLDRFFTIPVTAIFFILPCCFCKRVDFLGCIGTVGMIAMLYPVFLTVYGYFKLDVKPLTIKTWPDDIAAMFAMMPVIGLGFQCQEVVVPVYSCMRERNLCNFIRSSVLTMSVLFVLYSVTGCFGYLTFGVTVSSNVMKMYNASDPIVMIGVGALIIKMIVTYPILALVGRDAVVGIYAELRGLKSEEFIQSERIRRYICSVIWFGTSLLLAVFTSGIGIVIKYLGSVATFNILVFPGMCLMRVMQKKDPSLASTKSRLLVCYGIFIVVVGTFCFGVVLSQAISHKSDPPEEVCNRTK